jgi:alpha-tubulin suppressor-like RCC1 family protein
VYKAHCWGHPSLAPQSGVVAMAGYEHMLFLMADGSVKAFGYNPSGQTYVPAQRIGKNAIKVAAGGNHSLVLLSDGSVIGFGSNDFGQIGPMPSEVSPGGVGAMDIAAGDRFSLFLLRNGMVLGIGVGPPIRIPAQALGNVAAISCQWELCGAVKASGELYLWGYDNSDVGAETNVTDTPPEVQATGVVSASIGTSHVAAILRNGTTVLWGLNNKGQSSFPAGVLPNSVKAVAAGGWHTVLLTNDGQVLAIGFNSEGQRNIPPEIKQAASSVAGVVAGKLFSCALVTTPPEPAPPSALVVVASARVLLLSKCPDNSRYHWCCSKIVKALNNDLYLLMLNSMTHTSPLHRVSVCVASI